MTTIYFTIVLFFVLGLLGDKDLTGKNSSRIYLLICFGVMLVLHTFFNPEYSDNYYYKIGYQEYQSMSFMQVLYENAPSLKAEVGYRVLCKLISFFSTKWVFAMFIISIIMLGGYFKAVKRYSTMIWLSVLLIMVDPFCQSLFVLRQHLAMGIILYSYPYILKKKLVPYMLICLLAISCHYTAAVFLPIYFIYNIRNNCLIYVVLTAGFIILYLKFYELLVATTSITNIATYGDEYFELDKDTGTNNKMALLMMAVLLIRLLLLKGDFLKDGINKLLSIILIIGTIISVVGMGFIGTSRMNMYYTTVSFLYIPNTFQYLKGKGIQRLFGLSYFSFLFYFMIKNSNDTSLVDFWFFSK